MLVGCTQPAEEYGFAIESVEVRPGFQKVSADYRQQLSLSAAATEALESGVALTLKLEMELRDSSSLAVLAEEVHRHEVRYLPLNRRYQLISYPEGRIRTFPRLRHAMGDLADLSLDVDTGPLAPGSYEIRTRISLDNASLPAPMHLPVLFSAEWQHDSEWSTWLFEIKA